MTDDKGWRDRAWAEANKGRMFDRKVVHQSPLYDTVEALGNLRRFLATALAELDAKEKALEMMAESTADGLRCIDAKDAVIARLREGWEEEVDDVVGDAMALKGEFEALRTENERLKKELGEARSAAGKARELLLGDRDYKAWHSEYCYTKVLSTGCVCGLSDALNLLDEADRGEYFKLVCQSAQAGIKNEDPLF